MFDRSKDQPEEIPGAEGQGEGVIISPDTRRANRIPPGQTRTRKWPVLLVAEDRAGYWEQGGYHMHGDPWTEERFRYG